MAILNRATLAEQAYEELQSQIVSGQLPAGRRLLAEELAGELSISQTPVKEALVLLERDGLVEGSTRRASAVRTFGRDDIIEIYEARILLELSALETGLAGNRVTESFLAELQRQHEMQMRHAERKKPSDLAEAIASDRRFHETIVGLTANRLLIGWHRTILGQTQTIRNHSIATYDISRTRHDHGAIIDALRARDFETARTTLRQHLLGSRDGLVARWKGDHAEAP